RHSRRIARKIVENRSQSPIKTTGQLAELCRQAYGRFAHRGRIDPATRTFQALRIAVNDEMAALGELLDSIPRLLKAGGVAVMISFHSLEDRMVKQAFRKWEDEGRGRRLTRKPRVPDEVERSTNRRSRSARCRALLWTEDGDS
ncbi:MAG: 16S rRNA (cytosine(1402)-N(4))-methyltransferase, partial [Phycisphaerae bacterium]|nr:16S rRNA (cytosine(1402)-N(4))-methyltransferase [Phycisphaerae bacterium]